MRSSVMMVCMSRIEYRDGVWSGGGNAPRPPSRWGSFSSNCPSSSWPVSVLKLLVNQGHRTGARPTRDGSSVQQTAALSSLFRPTDHLYSTHCVTGPAPAIASPWQRAANLLQLPTGTPEVAANPGSCKEQRQQQNDHRAHRKPTTKLKGQQVSRNHTRLPKYKRKDQYRPQSFR